MKKILKFMLIVIISVIPIVAFANNSDESYIYQRILRGGYTLYPSLDNYQVKQIITGDELGVGKFLNPKAMFSFEDKLYILDSGNNRVIALNEDLEVIRVIDEFTNLEGSQTLNDASGISVTADYIYIADTMNQRILKMTHDGDVIMQYARPDSELLADKLEFLPQQVVVDNVGNIYTNARGILEGLVTYNDAGNFLGLFAGDKIDNLASIADLIFWKNFLTEEQQSRMKSVVPMEYRNITIDEQGSIFTVNSGATDTINLVRKYNYKGTNLLEHVEGIAIKGYGNLNFTTVSEWLAYPAFIDISVDENGLMFVLDNTTGQVFVYDQMGNMITVFGGYGSTAGNFKTPMAISTMNSDVFIADANTGSITQFSLTEYGSLVNDAMYLYNDGRYLEAKPFFEQIVSLNPSFLFAYTGIGKALLTEGKYEESLAYFELSYNQEYYSEAYEVYRKNYIRENFAVIAIISILVIIGIFVLLRLKKQKKLKFIGEYIEQNRRLNFASQPFKMFAHPIDVFEDIKYKNTGSLTVSTIIIALLFFAMTCEWIYTGFAFKFALAEWFWITQMLLQTVGIFLIWVFANYGLCCLIDGKATLKQLFIGNAYALLPMILSVFINVILSQFITQSEGFVMGIVSFIGMAWTAIMIFTSIMVLHAYSFKKTIWIIFATLVCVQIVIFLISLCTILGSQVITFVASIYDELIMRL